ncbi:MAG: cytochrome b N-terminal domain-containing protein [Gemmatimonadota bacterium]|nr:cytochrome b N-terminal domain-containing protein [Gemmatimonadota bacterium]
MVRSALSSIGTALSQTWRAVKASTDASVLATARFLGFLYGPIDRSLPVDQALKKTLNYRLAPHVGWRHSFGGIAYLLFVILVATGVMLVFYYRPSPQEAHASVQHIVSDVAFGWLVRDVHAWSANLIVIALLLHIGRVFLEASYKPPRETNWLIGLLLMVVVFLFGASGYLLPWDQWSYWLVAEITHAMESLPMFGATMAEAVRGDEVVSGATLSRFFALHVVLLPWVAAALLVYHFTLVRRRGIAPPMGVPGDAPKDVVGSGIPFFPDHLLRSLIVSALVIAVVITLAAFFPRPVGDPADISTVPDSLVTTWLLADVARALIRYVGPWLFIALVALLGGLVVLPLFDRRPARQLRDRRIALLLGAGFVLIFAAAWYAGRQMRDTPPSIAVEPRAVAVEPSPISTEPLGPSPIRPAPSADEGGVP